MKIHPTLVAAVFAVLAPSGAQTAESSALSRALQASPAAERPLILAQQRDRDGNYTCELDGRQVPRGLTRCYEGYVQVCSARGTWDRTTQRC